MKHHGSTQSRITSCDFQTYPQLYDHAARVLRHKEDLPFLELEGRGKKKTFGYTFEGITGSVAQVST